MKRWTFTYIMLLMIASCSYDAVVEMPDLGKEITFQAGVETKGTETRDYNLDYIDVKSYLISDSKAELFFDDKTFERIGDWFCSDPAYYWPSDKPLLFLLWHPSAEKMGMTVMPGQDLLGESSVIFKNVSPKTEIAEQQDLLFTIALGSSETGVRGLAQNGDLVMQHLLSQIEIRANKGYQSSLSLFAAGVRIVNLYGKADFSINGDSFQLDPNSKTCYEDLYEDNPIEIMSSATNVMSPESGTAFVLPQDLEEWDPADNNNKGAYISILLQVRDNTGKIILPEGGTETDYEWRAVPMYNSKNMDKVFNTLKASEIYNYTLDFSEGMGYPDPLGM